MHDPDSYSRFRPEYLAEIFDRLRRHVTDDSVIVDLGAGTGLSIRSMIRAGVRGRFVGIEPDAAMLDRARAEFAEDPALASRVEWHQAAGEVTGLPDKSADAVTIGSAYHWMDAAVADAEILRIAKPGAMVLIFEYQFPKTGLPDLDEWIRRQFNTTWKLDEQQPRGTLEELYRGLATDNRVRSRHEQLPRSMDHAATADDLVGLIFSQARALSHLGRLPSDAARAEHRAQAAAVVADLMLRERATELTLKFKLSGVLLELR